MAAEGIADEASLRNDSKPSSSASSPSSSDRTVAVLSNEFDTDECNGWVHNFYKNDEIVRDQPCCFDCLKFKIRSNNFYLYWEKCNGIVHYTCNPMPRMYERTQQLRPCTAECPMFLGDLCEPEDHEETCDGKNHVHFCKNFGPCELAHQLWREVRDCHEGCFVYNLTRDEEILRNFEY